MKKVSRWQQKHELYPALNELHVKFGFRRVEKSSNAWLSLQNPLYTYLCSAVALYNTFP